MGQFAAQKVGQHHRFFHILLKHLFKTVGHENIYKFLCRIDKVEKDKTELMALSNPEPFTLTDLRRVYEIFEETHLIDERKKVDADLRILENFLNPL